MALLMSVLCFAGYHYSSSLISFVEDITGQRYETETYSVYVLKDSGYKELDYLKRQSVGYLSTNPHRAETETQLQRAVSHKAADYESIGELVTALYNSSASAVVMNNSYLDMLAETDVNFEEKTRVLYTFEVRSDVADIPNEVDIKTEPFIMLISGTDSRVGLQEVARSDVNMLAVVNPKEHKILLVSIPRDYYVQLHGTTGTKDKLTHAGVYGIEMSRKTIEDLFGININYTTKVSFGTVISVVDAIGGIEINSDRALTTHTNKSCHIQQGVQTLDSACALAYARERYAYESGDRHRVQNQQDVTEAILKKLGDPRYLAKYPKIMKSAEGSFETSMSYDMITDFAKAQLASLHPWTIEKISVDGTGAMLPTYSMGAQNLYVMIPDQSTVDAAKAKINEYLTVSEPEVETAE
jgi:LCP family protein required for cell wall assembly